MQGSGFTLWLKMVLIVSSVVVVFSSDLVSFVRFYGFVCDLSRFSLDLIDFSYKLDFEKVLFLTSFEF